MAQKKKFVSLADLKKDLGADSGATNNNQEGVVYSTESGRVCPDCGRPAAECICKKKSEITGDGKVRVSRETKGRKGKGVTLVKGLPLTEDDLKVVAKKIKQTCGVGGTVKNGTIEIQGDHREQITGELQKMGYAAKQSGG